MLIMHTFVVFYNYFNCYLHLDIEKISLRGLLWMYVAKLTLPKPYNSFFERFYGTY